MSFVVRLLPWWAWAGVLSLALAVGGTFCYKAGANAVRAEWREDRDRMRAQIDAANLTAHQLAEELSKRQAARVVRTIARKEEVAHALDADSWSAGVIPDGLRHTIETAAADTAAGVAD